jgi:putative Ig domain-containing protein
MRLPIGDRPVSIQSRAPSALLALAFGVTLLTACADQPTAVNAPAKTRPSLAIGTDPVTGASIITDKDDYLPGDTVHITGTNWTPGEAVHIVLTEDPQTHDPVAWDVVADSAGKFTDVMYLVADHDLGVTFTLTATGAVSGSSATAMFTDGSVTAAPITIENSTCTTGQTAFAPGETVCASVLLSVSGGGQGNAKVVWISPTNDTTVTTVNGLNGTTQTSTFLPTESGVWTVKTCSNGSCNTNGGNLVFDSETFTVSASNTAPVLNAIGPKSVDEETQLSFTATATDDGLPNPPAALTFSLGTPAAACGHPNVPVAAAMTSGGAFTWTPTESEGPGTYCARIVVSDGALSDFEDIVITVNEVNKPPVLTVPADFSTPWGDALSGVSASATDPDLPANTLTFSLTTYPTGMSIDGTTGAITWTPGSSQIGPNTVTVRVTDNGTPAKYDEKSFTITVTKRATTLTYDGSLSGQYSDQAKLSATLKDASLGTALSGETVSFTFDGTSAGSDATDASGKADVLYTVPKSEGSYTVAVTYAGSTLYLGSGPTSNSFVVNKEDAEGFTITNTGSLPVGATSFSVTIGIKEARLGNGNEPNQNDGQLPGDIANVSLTASGSGYSGSTTLTGVCANIGTAGGSGYSEYHQFTCTFWAAGNIVIPTDVYMLTFNVGGSYYRGSYDDVFSIWDPSAGFATGGGWFMINDNNGNDRVSFGFSFTMTKGKTSVRGGLVVIRHLPGGGVCRAKSNSMNAPSVVGNTATLAGKGNYNCVVGGITTVSQGNLNILAAAVDNGTSGIDQDQFKVLATDLLSMGGYATLKGGNVQVPQPQNK